MDSKLGLNLWNQVPNKQRVLDWICRVKPAVVMGGEAIMDDVGFWLRIAAESPQTILIGRKFVSDQSTFDARGLADQIIDLVCRAYPNHPVRLWMGYCQMDPHTEAEARERANFQIKMATYLGERDIGFAPYDGYCILVERDDDAPHGWTKHFYHLPEVQEALSHPNAKRFVYHQYWHHPADRFLDLPHDQLINGKGVWIDGAWGKATWWMYKQNAMVWLRRRINPAMVSRGLNLETTIETYSGDGAPPWGGDKQGGWRNYTNAEDCLRQIKRVDLEGWQEFEWLDGAAIFILSFNPDWLSYDYARDGGGWVVLDGLGDHIIASREEKDMDIIDITDQLPKHATLRFEERPLDAIRYLVVHHTASAPSTTPQATARYHISPRASTPSGWPGIGYHFWITEDGRTFQVNNLETQSYHCKGHNRESVGICLPGRFDGDRDPPPEAQLHALEHLLETLQHALGILDNGIKGHYELTATLCPGSAWFERWRDSFLGLGDGEIDALRRENAQLRQLVKMKQDEVDNLNGVIDEAIRVLESMS